MPTLASQENNRMDPLQSAENAGMPKQSTKTIDLSEDQRMSLFGDMPCESGKAYTVTLTAGDVGDSGFQTFEVGSKAEGAIETEVENEGSGTMPPPEEEPQSNEKEISALGYDRSKFLKKKQAPKMDARSLEFD
jgi:hypothetical protein